MRTFTTDGLMHTTDNFDTPTPTWKAVDLKALGMRGTLREVIADTFSPRYQGTGDEIRMWIRTDAELGLLVGNDDSYTYTVKRKRRLLRRLYLNVRQWWKTLTRQW